MRKPPCWVRSVFQCSCVPSFVRADHAHLSDLKSTHGSQANIGDIPANKLSTERSFFIAETVESVSLPLSCVTRASTPAPHPLNLNSNSRGDRMSLTPPSLAWGADLGEM